MPTSIKIISIYMIAVVGILLGGCQVSQERLALGTHEQIDLPDGMFGAFEDKTKKATRIVSYDFQVAREKLATDTPRLLRTLAYFEWLANDIRSRKHQGVATYKIKKIIDARNELRKIIGMSSDASSSDAVNELFVLAKAISISGSETKNETLETAARRKLISSTKSKIDKLIGQINEKKENADE